MEKMKNRFIIRISNARKFVEELHLMRLLEPISKIGFFEMDSRKFNTYIEYLQGIPTVKILTVEFMRTLLIISLHSISGI